MVGRGADVDDRATGGAIAVVDVPDPSCATLDPAGFGCSSCPLLAESSCAAARAWLEVEVEVAAVEDLVRCAGAGVGSATSAPGRCSAPDPEEDPPAWPMVCVSGSTPGPVLSWSRGHMK